jgi:plastocyanin
MSVRGRWLVGLLLCCGPSIAAADQTVDVGPGIAFSPSTVVVAPGEKVTWVWQSGPHSSTSDATSGSEVWDSGILSAGATFSHTFSTVGDHPYYCLVHSSPGGTMMNGIVRVAAPTVTPTPPIPTPTPGPAEAAAIPAMNGMGIAIFAIGLAAAALLALTSRKG